VRSKRGNDGTLSPHTKVKTTEGVKDFIAYTGLKITNHTMQDLVEFKRQNPTSREIELALKAYSMELPIKSRANRASHILGIFRHNFAPLNVRINTHFEPAEENCTEGIFQEIYSKLTEEQRLMIQWALFLPERATAAYRVP